MELSNYKDRLFELLPQLYQIYDKGDGSLKAFLEAVGETLDDMERNIAELYDDSFIETCHEWVIPYIGKLIGARLIGSEGAQNRLEVMNSIRWRKRKGNLRALEEMAADITGWGARGCEFFEQLGWSQNLNHLKHDRLQTPNLIKHKQLLDIGSAENTVLHTIDIRRPCGKAGWFNIKNTGLFLSTVLLSHYRKIPLKGIFGQPSKFIIGPANNGVDLFDGDSQFALSETTGYCERIKYFGLGKTIDIFSGGVLAAANEELKWKGLPSTLPPHPDILDLKDNDGIMPVDWRTIEEQPLNYTITAMVLYQSAGKARLKELGSLDLSAAPFKFNRTFAGNSKNNGRLIIGITPHTDYNRSFPGMILTLLSKSDTRNVFSGDKAAGIYEDRMYCYLPAASSEPGIPKYFAVDRYGSTYEYIYHGTQKQPDDAALYDFTRLARATEGVIFPSRKLTASSAPCRSIYSLAKNNPLEIVDRGQFLDSIVPAQGWELKAWNRDNQPGGGVLRLLSSMTIRSAANSPKMTGGSNQSMPAQGNLILSIHQKTDFIGKAPEMEIIVTDERGWSILVYMPQIDDLGQDGAYFYVADDGATYRVNGDSIPDGIVVLRTPQKGPGGAFNQELLAKYSAGQVLPLERTSPIRHRIAVRCDLTNKNEIYSGVLAIDTTSGRIAFPEGERPDLPLSADFYYGMSSYLGAGAYLRAIDPVQEERLIRVSKRSAPDGIRHLRPPAAGIISQIKIFDSIGDAVTEVTNRNSTGREQPWVIQIEDSEMYTENIKIDKPISCGLVIRAAQFQSPLWEGSLQWQITDDAVADSVVTELLSLNGLTITRSPEIRNGRFRQISIANCTFLNERLILSDDIKGPDDEYPELVIDNCIIRDRVSIHGYFTAAISNSALDPTDSGTAALVAEKALVTIEECTVTEKVISKELSASESIFTNTIKVLNPQKGCVRYCRIEPAGNVLPYSYKCMTDPVTFCNTGIHSSGYLKLNRSCEQAANAWAENGGEVGVHHQANYTLKIKNLKIKCEEYLPVGLTPVFIDTGSDYYNERYR